MARNYALFWEPGSCSRNVPRKVGDSRRQSGLIQQWEFARRLELPTSASNADPFPLPVRPRNYGLACQKANSDSIVWTTAEKWLDRELGLDDRTGFTRRQCTTMRKLCRPSGRSNTHVLGPFPSHSEYRIRSLIVICSIIYPLPVIYFFLSPCAKDACRT
jgi:hypothetical protein